MKKVILTTICLMVLGIATAQAQEKFYLVSAGVADYPGLKMDLRTCANDANTIRWVYQENKKAESVTLMNSKATIANILAALEQQFMKASSEDAIIFFFSGHGSPGSFVCYDGLLDYSRIKKIMAKSKAKYKMVFADACFSGKMTERRGGSSGSRTPNQPAPAEDVNDTEVMFFLSSRPSETSLEFSNMKNSLFTSYLQRGLRGGADTNKDRIITAIEIFLYVQRHVVDMSRDRQHPVMWGKFDDNMSVIAW